MSSSPWRAAFGVTLVLSFLCTPGPAAAEPEPAPLDRKAVLVAAAGPAVQRKESTRVAPNAARHGDEDMMEPFARDGDGAPGSRTAQQ